MARRNVTKGKGGCAIQFQCSFKHFEHFPLLFVVFGIKPWASHKLGGNSTTEPHQQHSILASIIVLRMQLLTQTLLKHSLNTHLPLYYISAFHMQLPLGAL